MPGVTPDTQPGSWGITLPPTNGSTYLGLVHDPSISWQEGAGQTLSSPMIAGTNYHFTIDLATTDIVGSGITPGPVELQFWGGWSGGNGCSQIELLWHSGNVTNLTWVTQSLDFTPSANYDHILFLINALDPNYAPYIMLDNMTPILPISDIAHYTYSSTSPGGDFCAGVTIQFTDSSYSPAGNTILGWNWNFGDGSPNTTTRHPSHTYATPGTYQVTLEISDNIPCTFSVTRDIVVYPYPTASFTADSACIGSAINFTNTSTLQGNPLTPTNFLWSFGDGNTDGTTLNTANIYANSGQYNATFRVTENGCSNSVSHTVIVFPYPVVDLGPDQTFCYGTRLNLDAGNPGSAYLWSDNSQNQHLAVSSAGTYSVTVTSGQSCTASDEITVVFYPRSQITVSPSDSILCQGDSLLVTVTGSNDIRWYPDTWLSDPAGNSVIIKPYTSVLYTVLGRNEYNCFDTAFVNITANELPRIELGTDVVLCNNTSYILRGESSDYTYLWQDGSTNSTFTVTEPGTYWLQANNSGCIRSDTIHVFQCTEIYVPNAFTPDNNLLNDYFFAVPSDTFMLAYFHLYIFDRWGGIVFQSNSIYEKWDGKFKDVNCAEGIYGWKMIYAVKGIDGVEIDFGKQGSVTLIR